jgi:hypothetical protein
MAGKVNASVTEPAVNISATVAPAAAVTFTGSAGVLFTRTLTGSILYSSGSASVTTPADTTSNVRVFATKPGVHTVTVTAGTSTQTVQFIAGVQKFTGRVITADPTSFTIAPENFRQMSAVVTDIFGNPVPGDDSVTATLLGPGTLTTVAATDAAGKTTISYIAPAGTGSTGVRWTMGTYESGTIPGAPAAVRTADVAITVGSSPTKSIVIVGERTTVSGKSGILVDGVVTGIEDGKTVVPYIRFPGETTFTAGTARPEITDGEFMWQRKTGKRVTVYVTNDDGDVTSNRVTIQTS